MKRYKSLRVIIAAGLVFILGSCSKWLENDFVPLPGIYFPAYEEGDTFMYKSIVTEDVDTFVVSGFAIDTAFDRDDLIEKSLAIFGQVVADTFGNTWFWISNEPDRAVYYDHDSLYALFFPGVESLDTTIQGFEYNDLMIVSDPAPDTLQRNISGLYYDWKYGIVKYSYSDKDSYELFVRPE